MYVQILASNQSNVGVSLNPYMEMRTTVKRNLRFRKVRKVFKQKPSLDKVQKSHVQIISRVTHVFHF